MQLDLDILRSPARLAVLRAAEPAWTQGDEGFDRITRLAHTTLGVSSVVCALVEEDRVLLKSVLGAPWSNQLERPLTHCFCQYTLVEPGGLVIEDARTDPRVRKNPATHDFGVRGYLGFPIVVGGQPIGSFSLVDHRPRSWSPHEIALGRDLAALAAAQLELRTTLRERDHARAQTEILHRFAASLIGREPLAAIYERAFDALDEVLGARRSSVLLFDAGGVMRFQAWRGLSEGYRRAVDGHSPWSQDERDPRPVIVTDVESDPAWAPHRAIFRAEGIRALAFLPIVLGEQLLGKFMVYFAAPRAITERELAVAGAISAHIANAIDRERTALERERMIEELRRTVRFSEMFAGILAHDLRNPLAAITTAAGLLERREESERTTKTAARILGSAGRMARMIDQLLDFTRLRLGQGLPLERAPVHLGDLSRAVLDELRVAHPDREILLEVSGDVEGTWDRDRLAQLVSNLGGNACQHGAPGTPLLVRVDGTRGDVVALDLHNQGHVPPDLLPDLFEPLAMARGVRTRGSSGLGLGLFITQQIALAHGGRIDVESSPEAGTRFRVELPRTPPARASAPAPLDAGRPFVPEHTDDVRAG